MSRNPLNPLLCVFPCVVFLTTGWMATAVEPESPSATSYPYYYFKERKPLTLDTTRVAVLTVDPPNRAGVNALGETEPDLDRTSVTPMSIRGWSFVSTVPDARTTQKVQESVRRIAVAATVDFVSPVFFGTDGGPVVITPRILVGFRPEVDRARAEAILAESKAGVIVDRDWANMRGAYRLRSTASDGFTVLEAANALAQRVEVLFAEPDVIFTGRGDLIPNDTFFGSVWGIHNTGQDGGTPDMDMDGPEAWDITTGDPSVKVLIIDVGVEQTHPDINQLPGADTTSDGPGNGGPVNACDNHGTAVAGCVSATINNNLGTVGIAPGCKSVSVRPFISTVACDGSWSSVGSWTVDALTFGESIGVRVTNNSNQYGFTSSAIAAKYAQTRDDGIVHFASAGNSNLPTSTYPASLPSVNSVAALERHGNRASFSDYGPKLFVSAPGQDVMTTDRTGDDGWVRGDYVFANGTSFASPYTAGVAALVLSINPLRPASSVEHILASTAMDLGTAGWDTNFGWGFVNAHQAVVAALEVCNDPGPPDCNHNGILDSCDLFDGTSADCNRNGVPDDCESAADCQSNGVTDICDIFDGTSKDCNGNGIPDECDIASGAADCQPNGVPDVCELVGNDANGNGIPDECDPPGNIVWDANDLSTDRTTRSLRFRMEGKADDLLEDAIRVELVELGHPNPRNAVATLALQTQTVPQNFSRFDTNINGVCSGATAAPNYNGHPCDPSKVPSNADCLCNTPSCAINDAAHNGVCVGNPAPPLVACTATGETVPPDVSGQGGCARWVGKPATFLEAQQVPGLGNYRAARLQCTPFYYDWVTETAGNVCAGPLGPLNSGAPCTTTSDCLPGATCVPKKITVVGAEILPSSTYRVQTYGASCKGSEGNCTNVSTPVTMLTRRHGDIASVFTPPDVGQPSSIDVSRIVDAFGKKGPLRKAHAKITPNLPEENLDVGSDDIGRVVDAAKGFAYPLIESGPCPCPSTVACGTPCGCDAGPACAACGGGQCVKVCSVGSVNAGLACRDNDPVHNHCPGGTCGSGFCRDKCGRCTP